MESNVYGSSIQSTRSESEMSSNSRTSTQYSQNRHQHAQKNRSLSRSANGRSPSVMSSSNGSTARMGAGGERPKEDEIDLHELSKGWQAAINRVKDPATRHEAWIKNDRGNLPLHSAASFRAPRDVAEALLDVYPEAASLTNNYGNLALHFTAWKKGPLDVEKLLLQIFPEGAAQKNNHGNLPLHYAAHYNAPLDVVKALYDAYPQAAMQKNNDANTPLDLAIADGASPNVVALLQGKNVPPGEDELLHEAQDKVDLLEKELKNFSGHSANVDEDLSAVLSLLMEVKHSHPHALYSAGINPDNVRDMNSLLEEVKKASTEALPENLENIEGIGARFLDMEEDLETQLIEQVLIPLDDEVERLLSKIIGMNHLKNQIRGLRRTIEIENQGNRYANAAPGDQITRHIALIGNPGTGKTFVARILMPVLYQIGAVERDYFLEVGRDDFIDGKSAERTVEKTRRIIEKARGGIIFVDEAYTLLPSKARRKTRDHGAAALMELAKALPRGDPLIIFAGYPEDLQLVMASDIGFKGNFLLQFELKDSSPMDLARIFLSKVHNRGYIPGAGLTAQYLAELIENNTDPDWRTERNGRISENMLLSVISEMQKKADGQSDTTSKTNSMPLPGSKLVSQYEPEDITISVEDIHNAIMNGL